MTENAWPLHFKFNGTVKSMTLNSDDGSVVRFQSFY